MLDLQKTENWLSPMLGVQIRNGLLLTKIRNQGVRITKE